MASRAIIVALLLSAAPRGHSFHAARSPLARLSNSRNALNAAPIEPLSPGAAGAGASSPSLGLGARSSAHDVPSIFVAPKARLTRKQDGSSVTATGAPLCDIRVIGVGGGGGNAVNGMVEGNVLDVCDTVEFWNLNTDKQALQAGGTNRAENVLHIGLSNKGLGAGGNPDTGRAAAEESREHIKSVVRGADLVFVTAGMGGGTGSGAAPVVADIAKQSGALTVAVVTKPFAFEGKQRMTKANKAIAELQTKVDTLIVVSNDKLLQIVPRGTPLRESFLIADDILRQGVMGISEMIVKTGLVNVDFADVRAILENSGTALMGVGHGKGKTRAVDAAMSAVHSPLLDFPVRRAKGILINIVGGSDVTLAEVEDACDVITKSVHPDANIIFGTVLDAKSNAEMTVTVLATGFGMTLADLEAMEKDKRQQAESGVSGSELLGLPPSTSQRQRGGDPFAAGALSRQAPGGAPSSSGSGGSNPLFAPSFLGQRKKKTTQSRFGAFLRSWFG